MRLVGLSYGVVYSLAGSGSIGQVVPGIPNPRDRLHPGLTLIPLSMTRTRPKNLRKMNEYATRGAMDEVLANAGRDTLVEALSMRRNSLVEGPHLWLPCHGQPSSVYVMVISYCYYMLFCLSV